MIGSGKRVLVVNEMKTMRLLLADALGREGFTIVQACDGVQALDELQQQHIDVVVTGYHMPRLTGLDLLLQSQMAWPDLPVILFSDIEWEETELMEAQRAFAWVRQSSDPGVLLSMLALAVEQEVKWKPRHAVEWVGA
jgi:CheY-like chemotaxis protein